MSLAELKENVCRLPKQDRYEFLRWVERQALQDGDLPRDYGDVSDEAMIQNAAAVWDADEHHAPPVHPAR